MHKITADNIDWARRIGFQQFNHLPSSALLTDEDCAQAACVGLCRAAIEFNPALNIPFKAYAYRLVAGAVIDDLRRIEGGRDYPRQKYEVHPEEVWEDGAEDVHSFAEYELELLAKHTHLAPGQKDVLKLIRTGFTPDRIAAALKIPKPSVYNCIWKIKHKLAKAVGA